MPPLPTATLGRTGLEVTRLGYGAMEVRGSRIWEGRPVTDDQAEIILNAVLDSGINFIDTANDYGKSLDELREQGESRTAFLLRFTLSHPHICTTIVGTLHPEHLAENIQAAERGRLAPEVYEEAKHRLAEAGMAPAAAA
ncbi:MAG: aldo/keto reductase [Nitrososphaerales archaeon]